MGSLSPPVVSLGYGRYRIAREPDLVRVPDYVLKCVGFVAELVHADSRGDDYEPVGSGFFVSVSSVDGGSFCYFVTSKHVIQKFKNQNIYIRVNHKDGGIVSFPTVIEDWYFHETDTITDVAVLKIWDNPKIDIVTVNIADLLERSELQELNIGIGDEVYIPGLFTISPGEKRNMPIVRHGNIAMIPDDQIQIEDGYTDVYLIEVRSIGGLSGSPVFVRETLTAAGQREAGGSVDMHGLGRTYLLGLMQGHWDIRESDMNNPVLIHDSRRGVNMGIGIVIPAEKIFETIHHPKLKAHREETEAKMRQARIPTPDNNRN